ncbi:MAG: cyclic lactone autoinducer peptide [Oscillospiraceae bacterium]|nr:cyclic lactone autoinducer peptide [Oscillospiraceae bacterium]MBQ7012640.1 cyclic lactone autoinducer peptide [Oscillospiraceae bacterium]
MNKLQTLVMKKAAAAAKFAAVKAAGASSAAGLHQPKEPAALKAMKK